MYKFGSNFRIVLNVHTTQKLLRHEDKIQVFLLIFLTALATFRPPGAGEALKGFSPPKVGAGAPPPKTNGEPDAAGANAAGAAAAAPPKANKPAAGAGAGAEAPKLKEGVAEKVGAAGAVVAAPNAGAAEPKTDPEPKAGVDEAPNAGVDPKDGAVEVGAPKEGNAGAAAGTSGFGAALKAKRPLLASDTDFPASEDEAAPKLKEGALEKLNPPAAGVEAASGWGAAEKEKLGPPDFFAEDSPESSSFVRFIPSVAAGLTALAAKIDGVGVELFPNAKAGVCLAASDVGAVEAEKLKTALGGSSDGFVVSVGLEEAPNAKRAGEEVDDVVGTENELAMDETGVAAAVEAAPKLNNDGAAVEIAVEAAGLDESSAGGLAPNWNNGAATWASFSGAF